MWMNEGKWNDLKCDYTRVPQVTMCEKILPKVTPSENKMMTSKHLKSQYTKMY
jgi:hypothetical protein